MLKWNNKRTYFNSKLNYFKINTSALLGVDPVTGEAKVQTLLDELKNQTKLILFIDEIHTLMGSKGEALDFANMFQIRNMQ